MSDISIYRNTVTVFLILPIEGDAKCVKWLHYRNAWPAYVSIFKQLPFEVRECKAYLNDCGC